MERLKHSLFVSLNYHPLDPDPYLNYVSNMSATTPQISDYLLLAILLILFILNFIISGAETAFFSLNEKDTENIHTSGNKRDALVSSLLSKPDKLLASIVISYNFLNISIISIIIYLLNTLPYFSGFTVQEFMITVVISITVLLFFMEIMPKLYASQNALFFTRKNSPFIGLINAFISPLSAILVKTTHIFNKASIQRKHEISMDDLSKALEITSNEITHEQEKDMLEGIIRFKDKTVDDILISRTDMVAADFETSFGELVRFIVEAGFSRIPVYEENPDNIKGILYVKDLLAHLEKNNTFRWQTLVRPAYFVPGTKRIDDLLEEFRSNKNHMAIVVDEYGGTTGIVTMEDILEEIVGDISDEYDEETSLYTISPDGSYIFEGKTPIEEFIKITGIAEKDFEKIQEEVDTIAGLMLEVKGDFPKRKETITFKKYGFQAYEMNKRRILKVRYIPAKSESEEA